MTAESLLGDFRVEVYHFPQLDSLFQTFSSQSFLAKNDHERRSHLSEALYKLILQAPRPRFLLPAIVQFIERVKQNTPVQGYTFSTFELWVTQFSSLSQDEAYDLRCRIVGRHISRDDYQLFFPIGMGKCYEGSHFVTAHASPDLDTTVASFWGWVDAFGARVSKGLHIWNVPGGPPLTQVEIKFLFSEIFGQGVFEALVKTRSKLTLTSLDLMTQHGVVRKLPQESLSSFDHERSNHAIIVVDPEGHYLGDWRSFDVEGVRQVITLLENCLRWMESQFNVRLISFFSTASVVQKSLRPFLEEFFQEKFSESEPAKEMTLREQQALQLFLEKVLSVSSGFDATFAEFMEVMQACGVADFTPFNEDLKRLDSSEFFQANGHLIENRSLLFTQIKKLLKNLSQALRSIRLDIERLEVAMNVKHSVFGREPNSLSFQADVEEVKTKMEEYSYLTVNYPNSGGALIPIGVVHAADLHRPTLGTVTLRDFCNREETKIPPFLEIISVIDHHKVTLGTSSPPMALISDAQSSNVLVAELSFSINDKYSSAGLSLESVEEQIAALQKQKMGSSEMRLLQRLLQKKLALQASSGESICASREYIEYLHYLFAILDDTDLLTKVTARDVDCVASLINRLKTIAAKQEVETVHFDDIARDASFAKRAAKRLLQNRDLYSLYSKIYLSREQAVNDNIAACLKGMDSNIFTDTKIQNGCCRVGQTKIFENNYSFLQERIEPLRALWLSQAADVMKQKPEIDFHLHMVSTIASASQLIMDQEIVYSHKDELWLWAPQTELGIEHLRLFLSAFESSPGMAKNEVDLEFIGPNAPFFMQLFEEAFRKTPYKIIQRKDGPTYAVMHVKAGSLNSRKALISPFLPKLND